VGREASRRHLDSAEKLYFLLSSGYEYPSQFDTNFYILVNGEEIMKGAKSKKQSAESKEISNGHDARIGDIIR